MFYVGIENSEMAKERIKIRVKKGGHDIPDEIVEKRYHESLINLKKIAPLCDKLVVYDNSNYGKSHTRCFVKENNSIILLKEQDKLPKWVIELKKI